MQEKQAKPGDVIETANGNRYLVLPNRKQLYVGHKESWRIPESECVNERSESPCQVVGRLAMDVASSKEEKRKFSETKCNNETN